jgi:hypothetical protein
MTLFRIKYFDNDEQDFVTVEKEFSESHNPTITAYEWAYDWAYAKADKRCDFVITEVKGNRNDH